MPTPRKAARREAARISEGGCDRSGERSGVALVRGRREIGRGAFEDYGRCLRRAICGLPNVRRCAGAAGRGCISCWRRRRKHMVWRAARSFVPIWRKRCWNDDGFGPIRVARVRQGTRDADCVRRLARRPRARPAATSAARWERREQDLCGAAERGRAMGRVHRPVARPACARGRYRERDCGGADRHDSRIRCVSGLSYVVASRACGLAGTRCKRMVSWVRPSKHTAAIQN